MVDALSLQLSTPLENILYLLNLILKNLTLFIIDEGFKIRNQAGNSYFYLSYYIVEWVDVFTRKLYKDHIIEDLRYCQEEKGLIVYAWCIMSNHIHLIVAAKNNNLSDLLRDFKKYTSKKIFKSIASNEKRKP